MWRRDRDAYIRWVQATDDVGWLRRELIERIAVNVGLLAENTELKRKVAQLEQGRPAG